MLKYSVIALIIGYVLDLLIGDPHGWPHIVRLIGRLISIFEKLYYPIRNKTLGGVLLVLSVLILSVGIPTAFLAGFFLISPIIFCAAESVLIWQLLAVKSLAKETRPIYDALENSDLPGARKALSMVVGRDTACLDEALILRAGVETVAENAADGVAAPLFYIMLFGAAGGLFCKAVNTMDSMIGYRTDRYLDFGKCAAKLDDFVNFLPARLCALCMAAAASFAGFDGKNALRIRKRDGRLPESPNAGECESLMAGALHIRLGGDAVYFGKVCKKPTLGDDERPIEREDLLCAHRILYLTSFLLFLLALLVRGGICLILMR